ncbi:MAG: hypothetical protein WKF77_22840 [Planctomycetaceae bacterium]
MINTVGSPNDQISMTKENADALECDGLKILDLDTNTSCDALNTENCQLNTVAEVDPELPDMIPVRMLNEFTYCPRLGYLEWVEGEWAGNLETMEGTFGHRRVDQAPKRAAKKMDRGLSKAAEGVDSPTILNPCRRILLPFMHGR